MKKKYVCVKKIPVSFTPITLGHFNSHGIFAITSTASAPPTPEIKNNLIIESNNT